MYNLQFKPDDKTQKARQIVESVIADINRGVLKNGEKLPSLFELSTEYDVSRDTVERAYRELKAMGYCVSVHGSGHYIQTKPVDKLRVLLVFNKLSSYKKIIYYSFLAALGERAHVDLHIHHYSPRILRDIIEKNLGRYNYYVVMPHFVPEEGKVDYHGILNQIPGDQLVLLDRDVTDLKHSCLRVFQDFERDIMSALEGLLDRLANYRLLVLVKPDTNNSYLAEIAWGFRTFCLMHNIEFRIQSNARNEMVQPGTAYVSMDTPDLAELYKKAQQCRYIPGRDVGFISFNDTPLKELLDITVISTDFESMGRTAAELLLEKQCVRVKNPFYTIRRGSL